MGGIITHLLKHSLKTSHIHVTNYDFSINSTNVNRNKQKRKPVESLLNK